MLDSRSSFFEVLAEVVAMLAENINMQMEAEYADLFDRKLMSLYGVQPGQPHLADMTSKLNSKVRTKKFKVGKEFYEEDSPVGKSGHLMNIQNIDQETDEQNDPKKHMTEN